MIQNSPLVVSAIRSARRPVFSVTSGNIGMANVDQQPLHAAPHGQRPQRLAAVFQRIGLAKFDDGHGADDALIPRTKQNRRSFPRRFRIRTVLIRSIRALVVGHEVMDLHGAGNDVSLGLFDRRLHFVGDRAPCCCRPAHSRRRLP